MSTDRVSYYDESLKKTIEGDFVSDGKKIHVTSVYGAKSASYGDLGACIDHNSQVLLAQKLLSELARGQQKPGQQQGGGQQPKPMKKGGGQQPNPMKKPVQGGSSEGSGGSQGGVGTPP
jgi:hypothetical protein